MQKRIGHALQPLRIELPMSKNIDNRFNIKNHDLKPGDMVMVDFVRSNHLDAEKGIGWYAYNVVVTVDRITDLTFFFQFMSEWHWALKNDVKRVKNKNPTLFSEDHKVNYAKDELSFRISRLK